MIRVKSVFLLLSCLALLSCTKEGKKEESDIDPDIVVSPGTTICGKIKLQGGGNLADVVVSDGVICTKSDSKGIYQLKSAKKNGMVFISTPSGYGVASQYGRVPQFFKQTVKSADHVEQIDFSLKPESGQDVHTRIIFGDIHLYSSNSQSRFFSTVITELNRSLNGKKFTNPYGLTLGDMTWDLYWTINNYGIVDYMSAADKFEPAYRLYNTVGNHDHDWTVDSRTEYMTTGEDWTCMKQYRKLQGPTCYSCNIGKIHYVSLDNAITIDKGDKVKENRGCWRGLTKTDMEWLKADLSYVDKDTPVIVSYHMPFWDRHGRDSNNTSKDASNYTATLFFEPFKKFGKVLAICAHMHNVYNNTGKIVGGIAVDEWNSGALCGDFWNTSGAGLNLCNDGSPSGYRVLELSGTDCKTYYKALGKNDRYFFRSYDRNCINLNGEFAKPCFEGASSDNYVYFHVWDYRPDWKIVVKEGSRVLEPEKLEDTCDPLYVKLFIEGKTPTEPCLTATMFRVKASSAISTVSISVTDEWGRECVENMVRPKAFDLKTYQEEFSN